MLKVIIARVIIFEDEVPLLAELFENILEQKYKITF